MTSEQLFFFWFFFFFTGGNALLLDTTDAVIKGSLLSAHVMHIYLNKIFHTHVEQSATDGIYTKYYLRQNKKIKK